MILFLYLVVFKLINSVSIMLYSWLLSFFLHAVVSLYYELINLLGVFVKLLFQAIAIILIE